ncbi:MAG TPA: amino acid permease [Candidatus Dormibacteraeota bacterium]|nr:amino acid permease [Candidatus Dormibacteraeota bacterium]
MPNETRPGRRHRLGVVRGSALYVGALIGPGLLLVPALGVQAAGPASILAWGALLLLSAPLAATFAVLGVRYPVSGGVAAYVRAGLGDAAAAVTGGWFLTAVAIGGPAVSLIGGYYVADLTASGPVVAPIVALAMFGSVLATNALGLRLSSALQLGLSSILVAVLAIAIAVAIPERGGANWTPFAPHGWWAVGTAANVLVWLFVGWEAVAQLAGEFRRPSVDLPRAMVVAFVVVTALYISVAVATIGVAGNSLSRVPLADLVSVGFGRVGRDATAVLAVALTMGTMNVYMAGAARLTVELAATGAVPHWLGDSRRIVPLRPLAVLAVIGLALLGALAGGLLNATDIVRATSSLFVGVYVLAIASAVRILRGRARATAVAAVIMVAIVGFFSGWYILVPAVAAGLSLLQWAGHRWLPAILGRARDPRPSGSQRPI